jgi:hypothetical protein
LESVHEVAVTSVGVPQMAFPSERVTEYPWTVPPEDNVAALQLTDTLVPFCCAVAPGGKMIEPTAARPVAVPVAV